MMKRAILPLIVLVGIGGCAHKSQPAMPQPAPAPAPAPAAPPPAAPPPASPAPAPRQAVPALASLVPLPALVEPGNGEGFTITADTVILVPSEGAALQTPARQIAELIRRATGVTPKIVSEPLPQRGFVAISLVGKNAPVDLGVGPEGYDMIVRTEGVLLRAETPAGLFYGIQTLRQLLPYSSEYEAIMYRRPRPVTLAPVHIRDSPRYAWRAAMLDVARHFFTVDEVKRFLDLLAMNKMNRLHLHLADDQGWRLEIRKRPDLTAKSGSSEVGGTPAGFYTQAQFADLVAYAADRFITIIPEIDMPGHTNAALSAYAELNCTGEAPPAYTGTEVGFSVFCVDRDQVYAFIDDVVGEIAAMTPGAYFHMGGDEVRKLTPDQYRAFVERVQAIVQKHGKQMIGWDEIATAELAPTSIVQHWRPDAAKTELSRAPNLILSPANRAYLDMKYDRETALGLDWAGLIPVQTAYDWDPATLVPGARSVLGIEAALWSETVTNSADAEFLAMPRLAALAEVAWSPQASRNWEAFRVRLGAQAPRWSAIGINFYRAPEIPWAR